MEVEQSWLGKEVGVDQEEEKEEYDQNTLYKILLKLIMALFQNWLVEDFQNVYNKLYFYVPLFLPPYPQISLKTSF